MTNAWATAEQKRDVITLAQQVFQWCPQFRKYADANYVETMKDNEARRAIRAMRAELDADGRGEKITGKRMKKAEGEERKRNKSGGRGTKIPETTPEMRAAFVPKMRALLSLRCLQD